MMGQNACPIEELFMRYLGKKTVLIWMLGMAICILARAETAPAPIITADFKEVYELLASHLEGQTASNLNQAAVTGLLEQLKGRAWFVRNQESSPAAIKNGISTNQFEGGVLDIRAATIENGVSSKISAAIADFVRSSTNKLTGVVLDLRFSSGSAYEEAAKVADLFLANEAALLDWGNGVVKSMNKTNAVSATLVVLINRETAGAAEALAAMLRSQDRILIIGAPSAGLAVMTQDFTLKTGQKLRIATAGIKLGNGETLNREGVKPDIWAPLDAQIERAFYDDPYRDALPPVSVIPSLLGNNSGGNTATARTPKSRPLNEAELMRERKERPGVDVDDLPLRQPAAKEGESEKPFVRDPVLGRALDLIKGMSSIQRHSTAP